MSGVVVAPLSLTGAMLLKPRRFTDARGIFAETWNRAAFAVCGVSCDFVQDNWSLSARPNTVRGLHFQAPPHAQDKLVRVARGSILDVIVDIRSGSPTFGSVEAVELSAANGWQLFVPRGFLHGFITREPDTEVTYKCSAYYSPQSEGVVRFDDPDLAIDWGVARSQVILSDKDDAAPAFRDFVTPFAWKEPAR